MSDHLIIASGVITAHAIKYRGDWGYCLRELWQSLRGAAS